MTYALTARESAQFKSDKKMGNITQELLETRFTRTQEVTIGFLMLFFAIVGKKNIFEISPRPQDFISF